jgi:peptide deformylase
MKILRRTQFGNPILRQQARALTKSEITSPKIQELIADMQYTLKTKKYGVGLAAPQVGRDIALSIIGIKPTPTRPNETNLDMVMINPKILESYGLITPMWEGCVSFGDSDNFPYAQVPRYPKIRLRWLDETGEEHIEDFEGLAAHVIQHEVDHLRGVLFVDRVVDTTTFITVQEFNKRFKTPQQ